MLNKKTTFLFLILFIVSGVTVLATLRGQTQNDATSPRQDNQKKLAEDFYTVTDYDAPEPADPNKKALRRARAKRYNMRAEKGVDPKRFMITEERESAFGTPPFDVPPEPALPAATSDAVVIGEITNAQAYLSDDKTDIYSEFKVNVSEVLKDCSSASITLGTSIVVARGGGGVRFPSGKVILTGNHAKPLPRIGRRYVLFLKRNSEGDFSILTGYELRAGRVSPLDGRSPDGGFFQQSIAYQQYVDADEATFLKEVRGAITLASSNAIGEGR